MFNLLIFIEFVLNKYVGYCLFIGEFNDLLETMNLSDSFSNLDKKKILRMAQLYPDDFDDFSIEALACELDTFIANVIDDVRLSNISGITELSRKLVQTKKHLSFPHLHQLLKLSLIHI